MLTQQSMICRKYHRTPVTYLVTFTWGSGNHGNRIPCGQCADNADSRVTVDDVVRKSHKTIAQINCTRQDDVMSKNGNVK